MSFLHQQYAKLLVARSPTLSHAEGMILMSLGDKANEDSSLIFSSWTRLAEQSNCNERTVRRSITRLESLGMIVKRSSKGVTNVIYFPVPDSFDPYKNEHLSSGTSHQMSPEQRLEASRELHQKLTGAPWYAPYDSPEQKEELEAYFLTIPDSEKMQAVRELSNGEPVTQPLPYDKNAREPGVIITNDRKKFDVDE